MGHRLLCSTTNRQRGCSQVSGVVRPSSCITWEGNNFTQAWRQEYRPSLALLQKEKEWFYLSVCTCMSFEGKQNLKGTCQILNLFSCKSNHIYMYIKPILSLPLYTFGFLKHIDVCINPAISETSLSSFNAYQMTQECRSLGSPASVNMPRVPTRWSPCSAIWRTRTRGCNSSWLSCLVKHLCMVSQHITFTRKTNLQYMRPTCLNNEPLQ